MDVVGSPIVGGSSNQSFDLPDGSCPTRDNGVGCGDVKTWSSIMRTLVLWRNHLPLRQWK